MRMRRLVSHVGAACGSEFRAKRLKDFWGWREDIPTWSAGSAQSGEEAETADQGRSVVRRMSEDTIITDQME